MPRQLDVEYQERWLDLWRLLSGGRAPAGIRVVGSLLLQQTRVRSLPPRLQVTGDLDLRQCERLRRIGEGLVVEGDLRIGGGASRPSWLQGIFDREPALRPSRERVCPLEELPAGLSLGGTLELRHCQRLRCLPEGLTVPGDLRLAGLSSLEALPAGLRVGGDLVLKELSEELTLPSDAIIGGRVLRRPRRGRPSGRRPEERSAGGTDERQQDAKAESGDWERAMTLLEGLVSNPERAPEPGRLLGLTRRLERVYARQRRLQRRAAAVAGEARRSAAGDAAALVPKASERPCYICEGPVTEVSAGYPLHCPSCAAFCRGKRDRRFDLSGRRALVTGGRIKIGYHTALRLLRAGAEVLVTTRYPHDAARRYAAEADCTAWRDRLRIRRLDLRLVPEVLGLVSALLAEEPCLEILINNAAQTLRPDAAMLAEADRLEEQARLALSAGQKGLVVSSEAVAASGQHAVAPLMATGGDQRDENSWSLRLGDVAPVELLEVLLVNSASPFCLASGLKPLLLRSPFTDRYIINVNGADGQFARKHKDVRHPHINMSKAALNMLTRTAARDYARDGIYINSVDTGWVSVEGPRPQRERLEATGFVPPVDARDAAARICDPIVRGVVDGDRGYGALYRHYERVSW